MKTFTYIKYAVALLLLSITAFTFSSCGGDEPSQSEKQLKLLEGTWTINSVKVDGVDYTNLFPGFTLTFTETPPMYTPTNGGKIWTSDARVSFTDATAMSFLGPNSKEVQITTLTSNILVLEMQWDTTTLGKGGRSESIAGNHVFTFSK